MRGMAESSSVVICFQFFEQLDIYNSQYFNRSNGFFVVICFQFFEQLIFTTAAHAALLAAVPLWFAFSSLKIDIYNSLRKKYLNG